MQANSNVQTDVLDKLVYAFDMAENAKTKTKIEGTVGTKTANEVYQPGPGEPYSEPTIIVNLQVADKFTYMISALSNAVHIDDEVTARTVQASVAFGGLRAKVLDWYRIRLDTKLKIYKAVVLSTLLYACETRTVYQRHAKRLNHFHLSCLRKLLKIGVKTRSQIQRS